MRYHIIAILVVAACISCGGNKPIPSTGMTQSGINADAILSYQNNTSTINKTVNAPVIVEGHSVKSKQLANDFITPQDDFPTNDIISPAREFDVPKEHFEIKAEAGGTIRYDKTGSTIMIPPDALVDKNGKQVIGEVDISYREFHTQNEIFFSGIPMDYEVNGEKQFFESAGMIDISASQNGKEVFVKKGSEISFKMSTDNSNKEVKLYELNKSKKKWTEIGEAPVVFTPTKRKKVWAPVYVNDTTPERIKRPIWISVVDYSSDYSTKDHQYHRKLRFKMTLPKNGILKTRNNKKLFRQATWFNNAVFEVAGLKRKEFKNLINQFRKKKIENEPFFYKEILADVVITNISYPYFTFEMSYMGKKASLQVQLYYSTARTNKTKKKLFDIVSNFPVNNFDGRYHVIRHNDWCIDRYDSIYPNSNDDWAGKSIIQREFSAKNFGVLNCDQPQKMPNEMVADAAFMVDQQIMNPEFAVLVDFERNCQFTYYSSAFSKFGYDPNSKNFIFTVYDDGNVGYILPDEFKALSTNGQLKIPMHLINMQNFGKVMLDLFPNKSTDDYTL